MGISARGAFVRRSMVIFIAVSAALLASACPWERGGPHPLEAPNLTTRSIDELTGADAVALVPARTGWNPGLVFQGSVDGDRINAEEVVCRNLFGDAEPDGDYVVIEIGETKKDSNFSIGADVAADLIPGVDLKADLAKLESSNVVKIEADRAALRYYTLEERLTLQPSQTCLRAIDLLKQRGQFDGRVFTVPKVFAVQGLRYEFSNTAAVGGEIGASVAKVVDAAVKAGYQRSSSGRGTTITSHDGWITLRTARPVFIKEWDVSGAVGAGRAVAVALEEVPATVTLVDWSGVLIAE